MSACGLCFGRGIVEGLGRTIPDTMPHHNHTYHTIPCLFHTIRSTPCHSIPFHCTILPYHTIPYHSTITYHTAPQYSTPYHTIPCHAIVPYHTTPHHTTPCHTIPCYSTILYHTTSQHNTTHLPTKPYQAMTHRTILPFHTAPPIPPYDSIQAMTYHVKPYHTTLPTKQYHTMPCSAVQSNRTRNDTAGHF